jgi:hypothetical protein
MTITEMRKYLEALETEGYGDNIMRTTVTDSGKHNYYGAEAVFKESRTVHNSSFPQTTFYFGLCESDTGEHYDSSKNTVTRPIITFRKKTY